MPVERPTRDIASCRAAHERMVRVLDGVTDEVARRPSLLPDWTVAHVVTHLARNAESMHRRTEAARRGELVEQYVGGEAGRAGEIEAGAARRARQIVDDALDWANRLDDTFANLPDDCWARPVRSVSGDEHPVAQLLFRRMREVEVHLVDLGIGFTPADWSQDMVDRALPGLLEGLVERADGRALTAWLLGRGPAPDLGPWG